MKFLQLVRWKNLLFIALLMILLNGCVLLPILNAFGLDAPQVMPWSLTGLLTLATVLIAAGGYAINDYFDTKIDLLNHPDKLLVGRSITKTQASWIHHVTTALGAVIGIGLAIYLKSITLGFIFIMVPGLLWFYSASYKRQLLIGNLTVALCAALVPLSLVVAHHAYFDLPWNYGDLLSQTPILPMLYGWMCGYAVFAFLLTLIREILKDAQDIFGDREAECRTLPIVAGMRTSKTVVFCLIAATIVLLVFAVLTYVNPFPLLNSNDTWLSASMRYALIGIVLPSAYLCYLVAKAKKPTQFKAASICCKFIMAIGSLYSLLFYFLLCQAQGMPLFGIFQIIQNQ